MNRCLALFGIRTLASLSALAIAALTGCAGAPVGVLALDGTLQAPAGALPALVDRSAGVELHSCADLIAALRAGKDLGEATETPQFNAWADCIAATLVSDGRAANDGSFDIRNAGQRLYRDLDLASVASSLAPRRPSEHYRLQDFSFDTVRITPLQAVLQGNGFSYTFDVLALGDFRHLGKTELLVRLSDRATNQGSYDRRSVLVVDTAPPGLELVAIDAIEVLKAGSAAATGMPSR